MKKVELLVGILAGGKATRMPNKLFLHTKDGPLISHSIRYAKANFPDADLRFLLSEEFCQKVHVDILPRLVPETLEFNSWGVALDMQNGVLTALMRMHKALDRDVYAILCGDNVYPESVEFSKPHDASWIDFVSRACPPALGLAVVRKVRAELAEELDAVELTMRGVDQWYNREFRGSGVLAPDALSLTTPWLLTRGFFDAVEGHMRTRGTSRVSLLEAFQVGRVAPIERPAQGWHDLGTLTSYVDYLDRG